MSVNTSTVNDTNLIDSLEIESRRSTRLKVLQTILGFFNTLLIGTSKVAKPKISKSARKRFNVVEEKILDIDTIKLLRCNEKDVLHQIYYFAGGGFQNPPSSYHLKFLAKLASQTEELTCIIVVIHPLAPQTPAPKAFPQMTNFMQYVCSNKPSPNGLVSFSGDSSGGNLAMSLTLELLRQDAHAAVPDALLLICPAVDLAHENPDLPNVEKTDPLLRIKNCRDIGATWAGEWDVANDARVSPLRATNLHQLVDRDIKVYGLLGSSDILTPDALLLRSRLIQETVMGRWLEWKGAMHCWVLIPIGGVEVNESCKWLLAVIKEIESGRKEA